LRLQPWATNKREDRLSVVPKSLQARPQSFSKIFYRLKQAIGKAFCVFEDIPELFAGIEFGTVWWKGNSMDAFW
jgi:hypothetical protein